MSGNVHVTFSSVQFGPRHFQFCPKLTRTSEVVLWHWQSRLVTSHLYISNCTEREIAGQLITTKYNSTSQLLSRDEVIKKIFADIC